MFMIIYYQFYHDKKEQFIEPISSRVFCPTKYQSYDIRGDVGDIEPIYQIFYNSSGHCRVPNIYPTRGFDIGY